MFSTNHLQQPLLQKRTKCQIFVIRFPSRDTNENWKKKKKAKRLWHDFEIKGYTIFGYCGTTWWNSNGSEFKFRNKEILNIFAVKTIDVIWHSDLLPVRIQYIPLLIYHYYSNILFASSYRGFSWYSSK